MLNSAKQALASESESELKAVQDIIAIFTKGSLAEQATILGIILLIMLPQVLYYLTLLRTMQTIDKDLRPFPPTLIWFGLLPIIGILWYLVYIIQLSLSLRKELARRQLTGNGALSVSISIAISSAIPFILPGTDIKAIMAIGGLSFFLWIVHWVKMAAYRKRLAPKDILIE